MVESVTPFIHNKEIKLLLHIYIYKTVNLKTFKTDLQLCFMTIECVQWFCKAEQAGRVLNVCHSTSYDPIL